MTKKDFELIAGLLGNTLTKVRSDQLKVTDFWANALATTNPKFDASRFRDEVWRVKRTIDQSN